MFALFFMALCEHYHMSPHAHLQVSLKHITMSIIEVVRCISTSLNKSKLFSEVVVLLYSLQQYMGSYCFISLSALHIVQLLHFCQSGGCQMFPNYGFYFEFPRLMKLTIFY